MALNANTQIYDKAVDRAAMIRLYERRLNGKIEVVLKGHHVKVNDLVANANLSPAGLLLLREAVDNQLVSAYKEVRNVHSSSLIDLVGDQLSYTYQNIENAVGKLWRTQKPNRRIAEDIVLNQPLYNNRTLFEGWLGVSINERKRLESVIRKGIAEGQGVNEIALAVRKGNVFNISMNQSKALVITSITSVTAQTDHAVYKANEKALQGWQYVAVLDSRTTELCAHRDGTIYDIDDVAHLPPSHYRCRSVSVPVVKSWEDLGKLEGVAQIRKRNLNDLSQKQIDFYDGQTALRESYNNWLKQQPTEVQLRHLGDYKKLEAFRSGQLHLSKFTNDEGNSIGIKELRALTDSGYAAQGDTRRFAFAKEKLDTIKLGAANPDDFISDKELQKALKEYYLLQAGELDGQLSYTNYRGALISTKKQMRQKVLTTLPTEDNMVFNPITGRYEDSRMYQPSLEVLNNNLRLVQESERLLPRDKEFITNFINDLEDSMSVNERAVITDNMRITFGHQRIGKEPWVNFKAVSNSQMKFDVMNTSDYMETQLRKDTDLLKKLKLDNYIDPVLGPIQLQDLHDTFISNIEARNAWEDNTAPKIARELRNLLDYKIPVKLKMRIVGNDIDTFYLKFAQRLALADSPDRDQLAVALGRDLFNMANYKGSRNEWYKVGTKLLDDADDKGFFKLETFGVQKRRMKSRLSNNYFGPYYDTFSVNLRITDPRIQEYAQLTRKVDVGLRVSVVSDKNRLLIKEGYKTYFIDKGIYGTVDTRIPITSTSSFSDFPVDLVDADMVKALNWSAKSKYKIDNDFYNFITKYLNFEDDKGKAQYYNDLNLYKEFMVGRGDAYERLKAMEWLNNNNYSFSNTPFLDHRARIYERGLIGPQSGETFRPFLSTEKFHNFSVDDYYNLNDQVGSFLGGLSDTLEGSYNSLSITGRQKIAEKWKPELIKIGNAMLRAKPNDIRGILESNFLAEIDGEEQGKALRFALELAKIDNHLGGDYSAKSLKNLVSYKTALALEQDASSSGAQIIALATKNKQLAQLSNVIPTDYKKRLYDEIAASTFNDPRFRELNKKLGLTEKDLRKAAKAQNMVTFYGAGERTGILNVEGKLAKILSKEEGVLVVKAADRDIILNEISARMARYETLDPELYNELRVLRQDVKDIFNKGLNPGDDILEQLYFLDPKTRDLVEKLSQAYDKTVTPDDFSAIAKIMSENLKNQVPILQDFTKYHGRLAEAFLMNAKPKESDIDWVAVIKQQILGSKKQGYRLPKRISEALGMKDEPLSKKFLDRMPGYKPSGSLSQMIYGVDNPSARQTGKSIFSLSLAQVVKLVDLNLFTPNKDLPKKWTNVPWINFDGKIIEQNFTQVFEERLRYRDKDGKWITNILQVPQKSDPTWWEEFINADGKINDIADAGKARTAYAVNGNHSNDATLVKQFHMWGEKNNVATSTVHDAFFTNTTEMLRARKALRQIYANTLKSGGIKATLDEMLKRGLPREIYDAYLNEAIDIGLIPVAGRSKVGGRILTKDDILILEDIMKEVPNSYKQDYGFYGIG